MDWNWGELIVAVVSAAVGWLMRHLNVWLPPRPPDDTSHGG